MTDVEQRFQTAVERLPFNPVFLKEILVYERSGSATAVRSAMMALAMCIMVLGLFTLAVYFPGPWRFAGRGVGLCALSLLAFASYGVMVPAATSIALERDRETFDTLCISSLEPETLVRGKILAAFFIGLMTKAPVLPACALAFLFGGLSVSIVPAFLVVIFSVDLAYAALGVYISGRHHKPPKVQAFIKPPTQAQLSLQRGVGILVFCSVMLLYGIAFLIPVSMNYGWWLSSILAQARVIGMLHPVLCLLFWGPVKLFGVECPLWLLTVVFHILITIPLYAKAVDHHRPKSRVGSVFPRLLMLPVVLFFMACALGVLIPYKALFSVLTLCGFAFIFQTLLVIVVSYDKRDWPLDSQAGPGIVLTGLKEPADIFRSRSFSSHYYALFFAFLLCLGILAALLRDPLVMDYLGGWALTSLALCLWTFSLSIHALTMNLRFIQKEKEQLLEVLRGQKDKDQDEDKKESDDNDGSFRAIPITLVFFSFVLPGMCGIAIKAAATGTLPVAPWVSQVLAYIGAGALAVNPMTAFLPLLSDAQLTGSSIPQNIAQHFQVSVQTLVIMHFVIYALLLLVSFFSFPEAPADSQDFLTALRERLAAKDQAQDSPDGAADQAAKPDSKGDETEDVKNAPAAPEPVAVETGAEEPPAKPDGGSAEADVQA